MSTCWTCKGGGGSSSQHMIVLAATSPRPAARRGHGAAFLVVEAAHPRGCSATRPPPSLAEARRQSGQSFGQSLTSHSTTSAPYARLAGQHASTDRRAPTIEGRFCNRVLAQLPSFNRVTVAACKRLLRGDCTCLERVYMFIELPKLEAAKLQTNHVWSRTCMRECRVITPGPP